MRRTDRRKGKWQNHEHERGRIHEQRLTDIAAYISRISSFFLGFSDSIQDLPICGSSIRAYQERKRAREDRRKTGFLEYEALKRGLSLMTIGVGLHALLTALFFSPLRSVCKVWVYLQLLAKHVEGISRANIPEVFGKKRRRRIGIRSDDVENSLKKTIQGLETMGTRVSSESIDGMLPFNAILSAYRKLSIPSLLRGIFHVPSASAKPRKKCYGGHGWFT